jgi:hypothetical protein
VLVHPPEEGGILVHSLEEPVKGPGSAGSRELPSSQAIQSQVVEQSALSPREPRRLPAVTLVGGFRVGLPPTGKASPCHGAHPLWFFEPKSAWLESSGKQLFDICLMKMAFSAKT